MWQESRENYFVALKKKTNVDKAEIKRMPWTEEEEEEVQMVEDTGFDVEDIDVEVDSNGNPYQHGA